MVIYMLSIIFHSFSLLTKSLAKRDVPSLFIMQYPFGFVCIFLFWIRGWGGGGSAVLAVITCGLYFYFLISYFTLFLFFDKLFYFIMFALLSTHIIFFSCFLFNLSHYYTLFFWFLSFNLAEMCPNMHKRWYKHTSEPM